MTPHKRHDDDDEQIEESLSARSDANATFARWIVGLATTALITAVGYNWIRIDNAAEALATIKANRFTVQDGEVPVSYTHLTLPTNREV